MTVTDTPSSAPSPIADLPAPEAAVVSGTSPLADGFDSRFFTNDDYHRFHARALRYDVENAFLCRGFRRTRRG
jgi:hypothetical protein